MNLNQLEDRIGQQAPTNPEAEENNACIPVPSIEADFCVFHGAAETCSAPSKLPGSGGRPDMFHCPYSQSGRFEQAARRGSGCIGPQSRVPNPPPPASFQFFRAAPRNAAISTKPTGSKFFEAITKPVKRLDHIERIVDSPQLPAQSFDVAVDGAIIDVALLVIRRVH